MNTNYLDSDVDLGTTLVPKSYLIENYPELLLPFKFAGTWSCGRNDFGQLCDNTSTYRSLPVQMIHHINWKTIETGNVFGAGIKTDGTLWLWGHNASGQLGDNTIVHRSSPVQTVSGGTDWKSISLGRYTVAAIKNDSSLWLWGWGWFGTLGDGTNVGKSSPIQTISGGKNWKSVSVSSSWHVSAIKTDGTLWNWGNNEFGQLGTNNTTHRSSPVQTVSGGTDWKLVCCGRYNTLAMKTNGQLWSWGYNDTGILGDNSTINKSSPVLVYGGGTDWKMVSTSWDHTLGIKTDGTLWVWGCVWHGRCGVVEGDYNHRSSMTQITGGGTDWQFVAAGSYHSLAIKTDGTLWGWGWNDTGELGVNDVILRFTPTQLDNKTNYKSILADNRFSIFIRDEHEDLL